MKIAFVDNLQVGGGLSRFSLLLCKSLVNYNPAVTIDYIIHYDNLKRIPEVKELGSQVNVVVLKSTIPKSLAQRVKARLSNTITKNGDRDIVMDEIETIVGKKYDLAYFPSAHMMKRPNLSIPVVGTLHDFNWKYFFGQQIFGVPFVEMMDSEILNWMNNGLNVCSSYDVVNEAKKLYPSVTNYPKVVHIAPVIVDSNISEEKALAALKELNIDYPYLLFPGNFYPHKNHLNLFTAFAILKQRPGFENLKLLLSGINTDRIAYGIAGKTGVQLVTKNSPNQHYDIRGLGYQPNHVIDALIKKARLLVSPSIYEAICTPGMDAWHFGTPTAISDIAPFKEHEQVWGVRSAFFDPMDPVNIADTLEAYLNNYETAKKDGQVSKENIAKYTWDKVAEGYLKVFEQAINK